MTINRRVTPHGLSQRPPFSAAFVSNDEVHHRIVVFEMPGLLVDPHKPRHVRMQHLAFEYETLDDLLGTFARLKGLGILPVVATDFAMGTAFYYEAPDQNVVELNINNYGNEWTVTEHIRTAPPTRAQIDPDKMIAARKAGVSPWDVHERAVAGEFAPAKPWSPSPEGMGAMAARGSHLLRPGGHELPSQAAPFRQIGTQPQAAARRIPRSMTFAKPSHPPDRSDTRM